LKPWSYIYSSRFPKGKWRVRPEATLVKEGKTIYRAFVRPANIVCPICGTHDVIKRGVTTRTVHSVPSGHRPTFLEIDINRVLCPNCNVLSQVKIDCIEPNKRYTKKLRHCILKDSTTMTIKDLSERYHIGYNVCFNIILDDLKDRFSKIDLKDTKIICIDEILFQHGHRYITIILDYETKKIIYVSKGKHMGALDDFYKQLGPEGCNNIKAVSMDMSNAYISSVQQNLKNALIIFDNFHIVKLFNMKLTALRNQLAANLSKDKKKFLKGIRWLLLKNPENLSVARNEVNRLNEALKHNRPLALGYYLKEAMRKIWEQESAIQAQQHIDQWIESAKASKIKLIQDMGATIEKYSYGIINWYTFPISSGPLEGINNKIKNLMRRSYGLSNFENLKLHLFALHETSDVLTRS
jgi:transposase